MLTKTYRSPPMVRETAKEHGKPETGRFWCGYLLAVSSQRFFFRAATSWILGRVSSQETDGSKELSSGGQFRSSAVSMKRLTSSSRLARCMLRKE